MEQKGTIHHEGYKKRTTKETVGICLSLSLLQTCHSRLLHKIPMYIRVVLVIFQRNVLKQLTDTFSDRDLSSDEDRIRFLFDSWIRDSESEVEKIRIWDPHCIKY